MKNLSYTSFFLITVLLNGSQLDAMGYVNAITQRMKKIYGEYVLGKKLHTSVETNKDNIVDEPKNRSVIFEQDYEPSFWVRGLNKVLPSSYFRESLDDYAKDVYHEIEIVFESVNAEIDKNEVFKRSVSILAYQTLYQHNLQPIIIGSSFPENIEQVKNNINEAKKILMTYIAELNNIIVTAQAPTVSKKTLQITASAAVQEVKMKSEHKKEKINQEKIKLVAKIQEGINRIDALKNKPLMSSFERSNRKKQFDRFVTWLQDLKERKTSN